MQNLVKRYNALHLGVLFPITLTFVNAPFLRFSALPVASNTVVAHLPLIDFGEGVPVGIVELDAVRLHPCLDESVFALAIVSGAAHIAHEIEDEIVANILRKFLTLGARKKIKLVIHALELRDSDGNIAFRQLRLRNILRSD